MVKAREVIPAPIPACPATAASARRFVARRFGVDLSAEHAAPALRRREHTVVERRSTGDARGADVLGWVSLAAVMAGGTAPLVSRLARHSNIHDVLALAVADTGDGIGEIAGAEAPALDVVVAGLTVPDIGSRSGWALAQLVGRAAEGRNITLRGFPMASPVVLAKIKARIVAGERGRL